MKAYYFSLEYNTFFVAGFREDLPSYGDSIRIAPCRNPTVNDIMSKIVKRYKEGDHIYKQSMDIFEYDDITQTFTNFSDMQNIIDENVVEY